MRKSLATLFIAAALTNTSFAGESSFAGGKKYPPYPDVWGYELSYPNGDRYFRFRLSKNDDGDIHVMYGKKATNPPTFVGFLFFTGQAHDFTAAQYNEFWRSNRDKELGTGLPVLSQITFSDGSRVNRAGGGGGGSCYVPFVHALAATDKNGQQVARKSLVYLLKEPRTVTYSSRCPDAQGKVIERAQAQLLKLVDLKDDTFLVYESNGNVILRLDSRLNTKHHLGNRVFLVDYEVIERLREQARKESKGDVRTLHQLLNDALANYLNELKERNPK